MHLCYIDESGTPETPGNSQTYILAGVSVPDAFWLQHDSQIENIRYQYGLQNEEFHVAWMMRRYLEQEAIPNFQTMSFQKRREAVKNSRAATVKRLKAGNPEGGKQAKKNLRETDAYVHLTSEERRQAVTDIAQLLSQWGVVRLFAKCIDKRYFARVTPNGKVDEQAFEQVVSRFERYLQNIDSGYGLLIHDNNPGIAQRHTQIMRGFLKRGTDWTPVNRIIETPLFVDSKLNNMVQLADLCAYALRQYLENGEDRLFDLVFERAERSGGASVDVRHYTQPGCGCKICDTHAG